MNLKIWSETWPACQRWRKNIITLITLWHMKIYEPLNACNIIRWSHTVSLSLGFIWCLLCSSRQPEPYYKKSIETYRKLKKTKNQTKCKNCFLVWTVCTKNPAGNPLHWPIPLPKTGYRGAIKSPGWKKKQATYMLKQFWDWLMVDRR